jgi:hypothetical protein
MEHLAAFGIALHAACGGYHASAVADAAVAAAAAFADADADATTANIALVADLELCHVAVSLRIDFDSCTIGCAVGLGAGSCVSCAIGLGLCTISLG